MNPHPDDRRKEEHVENDPCWIRECLLAELNEDTAATCSMGNQQREKEEEIERPAKEFSLFTKKLFCHRYEIDLFWNKKSCFQDKKSTTNHGSPSDQEDQHCRQESSRSSRKGESQHAK